MLVRSDDPQLGQFPGGGDRQRGTWRRGNVGPAQGARAPAPGGSPDAREEAVGAESAWAWLGTSRPGTA